MPPAEEGVMADARVAGDVRIGISGWRYPPWRGVFYPAGLAQRRELEYASRRMTSSSRVRVAGGTQE